MTDDTIAGADDLSGTVDDWIRQLEEAGPEKLQSAEWLLRQLRRAVAAWAADETQLDIDTESRADY